MIKRIFRILWKTAAWFVGLSFFFVLLFKWVPVPVTPLMVIRCVEQKLDGKPIKLKHDWVSMKKISKNMQLAAICSEDQNFEKHWGFDLEAIDKAVKESQQGNKRVRGASTISQQTAKNLSYGQNGVGCVKGWKSGLPGGSNFFGAKSGYSAYI